MDSRDYFSYVKIGKLMIFKFSIYYNYSSTRTFSGMPSVAPICAVAARNNSNGKLGFLYLSGNSVSNYSGGMDDWTADQHIEAYGSVILP